MREEQFLVSPGYSKVCFPIHQVHWVLGVRGTSAEANLWINKSKIPCLFWTRTQDSCKKKKCYFSVSFLLFICEYYYICSAVVWITFCCLMFWSYPRMDSSYCFLLGTVYLMWAQHTKDAAPLLQQKGGENTQLAGAALLQCGPRCVSASLLQTEWELCWEECVI